MDPIAHTLTGAALAGAGLRRVTPLATAALVLGANAPDVDILASYAGDYAALSFRRGWTHGLLAMAVWPLLLTGLLLYWDRRMRRRGPGGAPAPEPARPGPLLGLAALAVATHPTLDWLNNYGMRWLMPFDGRWFYGDALFIIDPWVWLVLGGAVFLAYSRSRAALAAWTGFALIATLLMLFTPLVPVEARAVWIVGLAAIAGARIRGFCAPGHGRAVERMTRAALGAFVAYMSLTLLANLPARSAVRAELAARGAGPVEAVMVGPVAADPFGGDVVAQTADAYYVGRWRWLARPHLELESESVARRPDDPIVAAASQTPEARRFLSWSRFPHFDVTTTADAHIVRIGDMRYGGGGVSGGLSGPTVELDKETLAPRRVE